MYTWVLEVNIVVGLPFQAILGANCYGLCAGGWRSFSCSTVIMLAINTWNYHDRLDSQGKYSGPYDDEVLW